MRQLIAAVAFLAAAVPVTRADEKDDAAKKLNGSYEVIDFLVGGKSDAAKKDAKISVTIKDGTIEIKEGDKERAETAKFTLDPSKKPAQIDIMPGKGNDKTVPGIYEVKETDKGTELTIAFVKGGATDRPKDFKGGGKEEVVFKLFRKK
jgi:uncharacterized protein (TIGR03067 family)